MKWLISGVQKEVPQRLVFLFRAGQVFSIIFKNKLILYVF